MNGIIYIATNKINGKQYVGLTTKTLEERKSGHKKDAKRSEHNLPFYNAINKYGWDNFKWRILYSNIDHQNLGDLEIQTIKKYDTYNNGYNANEGGYNSPSKSLSAREKISKANKGRLKGIKRPDISASNKKRSYKWKVTEPNGRTKTIIGLSQYCEEKHLDASAMVRVSKNKQKSHKGYKIKIISKNI